MDAVTQDWLGALPKKSSKRRGKERKKGGEIRLVLLMPTFLGWILYSLDSGWGTGREGSSWLELARASPASSNVTAPA